MNTPLTTYSGKKIALFSNENNNSSSLIAEVLLTSFINEKES